MTTATTLDRNAHANELDTEGQPTGGFPDRYEDEAPALDVSLYHEPTAADQQWVASRALTLAEQVDREADRYRLDRSPLAVLCARTLDELALKLRMTEASTAEEYEARREVLDATIRDEWEARGYEAGRASCPCQAARD